MTTLRTLAGLAVAGLLLYALPLYAVWRLLGCR